MEVSQHGWYIKWGVQPKMFGNCSVKVTETCKIENLREKGGGKISYSYIETERERERDQMDSNLLTAGVSKMTSRTLRAKDIGMNVESRVSEYYVLVQIPNFIRFHLRSCRGCAGPK